MVAKYFESLPAYQAYLKAEMHLNGWTAEECQQLLLKAELESQSSNSL